MRLSVQRWQKFGCGLLLWRHRPASRRRRGARRAGRRARRPSGTVWRAPGADSVPGSADPGL